MPQISKGDTFANNQQLTAARLNQLVDAATITVNVITDQTQIAANTLEATDTTIVSDSGVFRKAAISDFVGSGIPIVSPTLTSTANTDLTLTPFDGVSVVGSNYISTDGITVTVTTIAAHGLFVNQVVTISSAGTGYNGTFKITEVTTYTFKYVLFVAATTLTPTATACTYVREGTTKIAGQAVVSDNLFVGGNVTTPSVQTTSMFSDNATIKTTNITTALQIAGTPVWSFVSTTDTPVNFIQCDATTAGQIAATCNQWRNVTSITGLTKTNKEIWVVEVDVPMVAWQLYASRFRIVRGSNSDIYCNYTYWLQTLGCYSQSQITMKCVIPESVVFSSDSINFQFKYDASTAVAGAVLNVGYGGSMLDGTITRVVRITKYLKP